MLNEAPGDGINTGVGGAILGGIANTIEFANNARKSRRPRVVNYIGMDRENYLLLSKGT